MIKKITLILLVVLIFILTLWFNNNNSNLISIDLEVIQITSPASIIFAVIFFSGWFFGLLCCLLYILKLLNGNRISKSLLRDKDKEINQLKNKSQEDSNWINIYIGFHISHLSCNWLVIGIFWRTWRAATIKYWLS